MINNKRFQWFIRRVLPVLLLFTALVLFFVFDLGHWLSLDSLQKHHQQLQTFNNAHTILAPVLYLLSYIAIVAFSLPGGTLMTVVGGFLFGAWWGGMFAIVAATIGATLLFLLAKTAWGDVLLAKVGPSIQQMQKGFAANALSYMLMLRLVPLFPFFLVNLAPAFLGVRLPVYVVATFFGIMPATLIFSMAGSGLRAALVQGQDLNLQGVMNPQMIAALCGLAVLALVPVIYRRYKN
ncbi:MAG: TVP38/TMEM64 family protein [Mariprofundaceae bacterium]|nr:TVP38/TMEM64 family protein [Mariprofundaceae bacterium]